MIKQYFQSHKKVLDVAIENECEETIDFFRSLGIPETELENNCELTIEEESEHSGNESCER